ncbi:MAG TPA: hypothetical protein VLQ45_22595 [Thermoanaerobaculia bacterium]|nr:hypothetical protein [Thermoanaerobaculia bacterium]
MKPQEWIPVVWRPRTRPLLPVGAAARGRAARLLAERLLARSDEELARLEGVAGEDLLVVLGPPAELPWADGAVYLGRDPEAPSLLLPTTREPSVPLPLLEQALIARALRVPGVAPPLAVFPDPPLLASTQKARPITRVMLMIWLGARLGGWIGLQG